MIIVFLITLFKKHCDLFKDGCHNVLSLVCLSYIVQFSRCDFRLKPELNIQNFEYLIQILTVKSEK